MIGSGVAAALGRRYLGILRIEWRARARVAIACEIPLESGAVKAH